jgi:hypothetical protein
LRTISCTTILFIFFFICAFILFSCCSHKGIEIEVETLLILRVCVCFWWRKLLNVVDRWTSLWLSRLKNIANTKYTANYYELLGNSLSINCSYFYQKHFLSVHIRYFFWTK